MKSVRPLVLFCIGGLTYIAIELLWRGYSHWTMFLVGGLCFVLIGAINEVYTFEMPLVRQMAISAVMVTIVELLAGLLINCNYGIWDYRNMPFNVMGQICLPYTALWFFLSLPAIIIDDYIRYWLFGEEKPHYRIFKEGNSHE